MAEARTFARDPMAKAAIRSLHEVMKTEGR